jgi:putative addiction module component (TIGR02574 family)
MSASAENVLKEALSLSALARAKLVDDLLASLDRPDGDIDEAWRREVEDRLSAYESGKMPRIPIEEVLAKYCKK